MSLGLVCGDFLRISVTFCEPATIVSGQKGELFLFNFKIENKWKFVRFININLVDLRLTEVKFRFHPFFRNYSILKMKITFQSITPSLIGRQNNTYVLKVEQWVC